MESRYYTAKEVGIMIKCEKSKAYDVISKLNIEIKEKYKDLPIEDQPLIENGKILKSYFDKKTNLG